MTDTTVKEGILMTDRPKITASTGGAEEMKPSATYYRCLWSSVVGTGVFRKRADQPNDFLIVTVALPKTEAEELADRIVALLDGSHDQEVATKPLAI